MRNTLKKCPLCGHRNIKKTKRYFSGLTSESNELKHFCNIKLVCQKCELTLPIVIKVENEERGLEVIDQIWNKRSNTKQPFGDYPEIIDDLERLRLGMPQCFGCFDV